LRGYFFDSRDFRGVAGQHNAARILPVTATSRLRAFSSSTPSKSPQPRFDARIDARDRWAIAAYIRALQLSEHATIADVPASERGALR